MTGGLADYSRGLDDEPHSVTEDGRTVQAHTVVKKARTWRRFNVNTSVLRVALRGVRLSRDVSPLASQGSEIRNPKATLRVK